MNKLSSIKYFMDNIPGRASSSLLSYISFDSGNGQDIKNITGKKNTNNGNDLISGQLLPSVNNFWNESGIGSFDHQYIKIDNTNNTIDFTNFTFITIIENTGSTSGATLFSTIQTGIKISYDQQGNSYNEIFYKGWEFGLTANNRLYFEYKDQDGIKNFVSTFNLPDKSPIYFQIDSRDLSFGYYDYFSNRLKIVSNSIDNDYIFDPTTLYIGYNPDSSGCYNFNKPFLGKMNQLLLFSPSIYQYELENIFSGFVCDYEPESFYYNEYYVSGVTGFTIEENGEETPLIGKIIDITGYETGVIGYSTGITGIESIFTGMYEDNFGNILEGFQETYLSGVFVETGFIPLSGYITVQESGFMPEKITVNLDEIYKYGKTSINLLSKIDNDDFVDIELFTGDKSSLGLNKNLKSYFDSLNTTFVFDDIRFDSHQKNYIVFVNGQLVNSGENKIVGSIYEPSSYIIYEDYTEPFPGEILFQNNFNITDSIFADFISGDVVTVDEFIPFHQNLSSIANKPNIEFKKYNLFINGQKLSSGAHYKVENNVIYFNVNSPMFTALSGKLTLVSLNYDYKMTGLNKNLFNSEKKYFEERSQVYKNGIRQNISHDYLEISKLNILSGKAIFDIKSNLIYNNNTLF